MCIEGPEIHGVATYKQLYITETLMSNSAENDQEEEEEEEQLFPTLHSLVRAPCGCYRIRVDLHTAFGPIQERLAAIAYCTTHKRND